MVRGAQWYTMCMRYALDRPEEVAVRFSVKGPMPGIVPRFNIAPTQEVPIIFSENGKTCCAVARWGLVPSWKQNAKSGEWLFNARAETLPEKPAFKGLLTGSRCIFPASGFYEWKRERGRALPYYLYVRDAHLFGCAGLYDWWTPPGSYGKILTCVMVTCDANPLVQKIHGRMPVILGRPLEETWLRGGEGYLPALKTYPAEEMGCHRVDERVNSSSDDDPGMIRPAEADHRWW